VSALGELVADLVVRGALNGATLSNPRTPDAGSPRRVTVDPVVVRRAHRYRVRRHLAKRTTDEIVDPEAVAELVVELVGAEFRQCLLHAPDADWQVLAGGKHEPRILRRPPTRPVASLSHDRAKRRLLADGKPVPFLVELGVQTPEGRVRDKAQDKFRQVNRFLELVDDVLPALPAAGRLRVVDFGSGKSYLTFALHHLLTQVRGREVDIVGLDLKEDVVAACADLAERLAAEGLRFELGDIASYEALDGVDLVVSLHACDTATDAALDRAIAARARVVLAVPCCQHELLQQLDSETLRPLVRHGTLRERFVAEVTDAARARLLELAGYDVQVVEFVPLEHTPKNVLLRATRRARKRSKAETDRLATEYRTFADALGIEPALERALRSRTVIA